MGDTGPEIQPQEPSLSKEAIKPANSEIGYRHESKAYWANIDAALGKDGVDVVGIESMSRNGFTDSARHFHNEENIITLEMGQDATLRALQNSSQERGKIIVIDEGLIMEDRWTEDQIRELAAIVKNKDLKIALHLRPDLSEGVLGKLRVVGLNIGETQMFGSRKEDVRDIIAKQAAEVGFNSIAVNNVADKIAAASVTVGEAVSAFNDLKDRVRGDGKQEISDVMIAEAFSSSGSEDCRRRIFIYASARMQELLLKVAEAGEGGYTEGQISEQEMVLFQKAVKLGITEDGLSQDGKRIVSLRSASLRKSIKEQNRLQAQSAGEEKRLEVVREGLSKIGDGTQVAIDSFEKRVKELTVNRQPESNIRDRLAKFTTIERQWRQEERGLRDGSMTNGDPEASKSIDTSIDRLRLTKLEYFAEYVLGSPVTKIDECPEDMRQAMISSERRSILLEYNSSKLMSPAIMTDISFRDGRMRRVIMQPRDDGSIKCDIYEQQETKDGKTLGANKWKYSNEGGEVLLPFQMVNMVVGN